MVRWGILGAGGVAGLFAEGLALVAGARLHAVASRRRVVAESFAARFGAALAHESNEDLVRDPQVDVVYVATPNEHHAAHALLAIEAGKPVLVEKPFALDSSSGRTVVEAARRRGVFCMEAMWMRFSPALREGLALARGGALGDLRLFDARLGFSSRPDPSSGRFSLPGGGALLDLGVYPLSLAQAVFGRPARVRASALLGSTGVDEQVSAILDYDGGRQAIVGTSLRCQLANAASIHGTEGVLTFQPPLYFPHRYAVTRSVPAGTMRAGGRGFRARVRAHPWVRGVAEMRERLRTRSVIRRTPGSGYASEAAEVQRCLRAGERESPEMTLDDTLAVLETLDAIRRATQVLG